MAHGIVLLLQYLLGRLHIRLQCHLIEHCRIGRSVLLRSRIQQGVLMSIHDADAFRSQCHIESF